MAFQFKIELSDISDPPVWRRLLVPEQFTFLRFHKIIQAVFGWHDCHLFQFSTDGYSEPLIGVPYPDTDLVVEDGNKIKLSKIFKTAGQQYTYIYDLGDSWEHIITLEKKTEGRLLKADCLDGGGACPPEDCGGAPGYENLKNVINDPHDPDYKDMREWLGLMKKQKWDAHAFNLEGARMMIQKL